MGITTYPGCFWHFDRNERLLVEVVEHVFMEAGVLDVEWSDFLFTFDLDADVQSDGAGNG